MQKKEPLRRRAKENVKFNADILSPQFFFLYCSFPTAEKNQKAAAAPEASLLLQRLGHHIRISQGRLSSTEIPYEPFFKNELQTMIFIKIDIA
jgi:hypothetical protein